MNQNDTLSFIKSCIRNRRIRWTYHVNMRLLSRFISRETILSAVETCEIIEENIGDKYLPSYLLLAWNGDEPLHTLTAPDVADNCVTIITAYKPDPLKWEKDFKGRRSKS